MEPCQSQTMNARLMSNISGKLTLVKHPGWWVGQCLVKLFRLLIYWQSQGVAFKVKAQAANDLVKPHKFNPNSKTTGGLCFWVKACKKLILYLTKKLSLQPIVCILWIQSAVLKLSPSPLKLLRLLLFSAGRCVLLQGISDSVPSVKELIPLEAIRTINLTFFIFGAAFWTILELFLWTSMIWDLNVHFHVGLL